MINLRINVTNQARCSIVLQFSLYSEACLEEIKNNLMQTKEGSLVTVSVSTFICLQADKLMFTSKISSKDFWLALQKMVVFGI